MTVRIPFNILDKLVLFLKGMFFLAGTVFLALMGWLAWNARTLLHDTDTTVQEVHATITDGRRTILVAEGTLADIRTAAKEWKNASTAQIQNVTATTAGTKQALADLSNLIQHTDQSQQAITKALIEDGAMGTKSLSDTSTTVQKSIAQLTDQSGKIFSAATGVMQETQKQIANPDIGKSLANLEVSTQNVADITASVDRTTVRLEDRVKQMLKPANFAWQIVKLALGQGASIALAIKR